MKNPETKAYDMYRNLLARTDLEEDIANDICRLSYKVSFEDGYAFDPKENNAIIFFVAGGFLIEEDVFGDGTIFHNHLFGQGSMIFNTATLFDIQQSFQVTYRAYCDTEILVLDINSFNDILKKRSGLVEFAFKGYSEQMAMERNGAVLRNVIDKKSRVIASLLTLSFFCPNNHLPMSVDQFSLLINITRQYCNMVINELSTLGYVTKEKGGISVLDQQSIFKILPENITEILQSIPKTKILNMDGCFYGKVAKS